MGMSADKGVFLRQVSCDEVCVLAMNIKKKYFFLISEGLMLPGTNVRKLN
jgi:hypothetical protein